MLLTVQGGSIRASHLRCDGTAFVWFDGDFTPGSLPLAALVSLEPVADTLSGYRPELTLTGLAGGILSARLADALPYLLHPDAPERLFTLRFADGNAALVSATRDVFIRLRELAEQTGANGR